MKDSVQFWRGLTALVRRSRALQVTVDPVPTGIRRRRDIPVTMSDGTVLRVDLYLPEPGSAGARSHQARELRVGSVRVGQYPTIMCAHPYGKDKLPGNSRSGESPAIQYRLFRQPRSLRFSAWTGWEAPDPAYWCSRGFAVVNADLRGFGHSDGTADLLTEAEARDYQELIEWAADQDWCNGRVGLLGVSYLALSQYRVAAREPKGLAAICPWEGFSDVYRDFARPGGGREDGFMVMWSAMTDRAGRVTTNLRREQKQHPLLDEFWRSRTPDLSAIRTPMLVCGSFSDQLLHSRGSHEAFRRAGSADKWLYTHRGGKWCTFYSDDALATQHQFFEDFLADVDTGWRGRPPVRLAIYRDRSTHDVVLTESFPPSGTKVRAVRLTGGASTGGFPRERYVVTLDTARRDRRGTVSVAWQVREDMTIVGSPWVELPLTVRTGADATLFAALRLFRDSREVRFEGSYGFARDFVTHGQLRLSHRSLDPLLSTPEFPVHRHDTERAPHLDEQLLIHLPMLPQATQLLAGDVLRLDLTGKWFFPTNPITGQFPGRYQHSDPALLDLNLNDGSLHLPVWDQRPRAAR